MAAKPSSQAQQCTTPAKNVALLMSISMQLHWIKADSGLPAATETLFLTAVQECPACCVQVHIANLS